MVEFHKVFAQNFENFGLKKLISTSFAHESKNFKGAYQLSLFEEEAPQFDESKTTTHGKIFTLTRDSNKSGVIDIDDLEWQYLEGDGDFRSDEVKALRDEADIIITNPPFSIYREFINWIFEKDKKFIVIGNKNSVTYKEIFPLIMQNKMWSGKTGWGGGMWFETKNPDDVDKVIDGVNMKNVASVWFTNIEHGRRHEPLQLMTMADNLKFSKHKEVKEQGYQKYDNYDAIEVPFTDAIPCDYDETMGVPVTFLEKYCPEQFEILGLLQSSTDEQAGIPNLRYYDDFKEMRQDMTFTGASGKKANGNPVIQGKSEKGNFLYNEQTKEYVHSVYARIVIKKRVQE